MDIKPLTSATPENAFRLMVAASVLFALSIAIFVYTLLITPAPEPIPPTDGESQCDSCIDNVTLEDGLMDDASDKPLSLSGPFEPTIVTTTHREGESSARCAVHTLDPDDESPRCEMNANGADVGTNVEFWLGYSICRPSDSTFVGDSIVRQWHKGLGPGDTEKNPPMALKLIGDRSNPDNSKWEFESCSNPDNPVLDEKTKCVDTVLGPAKRGEWSDFIFHLYLTHKSTGFYEVWLNDKKIVSKFDVPTWYNEYTQPTLLKFGQYETMRKYAEGANWTENVLFTDATRTKKCSGSEAECKAEVAQRGDRMNSPCGKGSG